MNEQENKIETMYPLNGTYEEDFLDFYPNGKLRIERSNFLIVFYFPGYDLRYNGDWNYIHENEIDKFIEATEKNWKRLTELKELAKSLKGTTLKEDGLMNMKLEVKDSDFALYIFQYNFPIRDENKLMQFLTKLKDVRNRVCYIKKRLYD